MGRDRCLVAQVAAEGRVPDDTDAPNAISGDERRDYCDADIFVVCLCRCARMDGIPNAAHYAEAKLLFDTGIGT